MQARGLSAVAIRPSTQDIQVTMKTPDELYVDLLKKSLTFSLWPEPPMPIGFFSRRKSAPMRKMLDGVNRMLGRRGLMLGAMRPYTEE